MDTAPVNDTPPLPEGFELEGGGPSQDQSLPEGFQLEQGSQANAQSTPPLPEGFQLENSAPQQRTWGEEIGRDLRTLARSVIPTTAGVVGGTLGAGAGAAAGSSLGPVGTVGGAIVGGGAGGLAASAAAQKAQDAITDALGIDSPESRAADAANPSIGSTVAEFAPAALTLNPARLGTSLAQRALSGGIMGAVDVGTQYASKGEVDPYEAVGAAATGAVLGEPRKWVPGAAKLAALGGGESGRAAENFGATTTGAPDAGVPAEPVRADANVNAPTPDPNDARIATIHKPVAANSLGTAQAHQAAEGYESQYTGGMEAHEGEFSAGVGDIGRDQGKVSGRPAPAIPGAEDNPGVQTVPDGGLDPAASAALSGEAPVKGGLTPPEAPKEPLVGGQEQNPTPRPASEQENFPTEQAAGEQAPAETEAAINRALQNIGGERPQALMPRAPVGPDQPFSPADTTMKYSLPPETQAAVDRAIANIGEEPAEAPRPQPLGANVNPHRDWTSLTNEAPPKAQNFLEQVGNVRKAIGDFGPIKWFRYAFTPEGLSEDANKFDNIVREGQGETNRPRLQYDKRMLELDRAVNNASPEDREDLIRNYTTGNVRQDNALRGPLSTEALKVDQDYQKRIAAVDDDHNFHHDFLPSMFEDKEGAKNFSTEWQDTRTTRPTIGDFMEAGFKLNPDYLRKDGSVDPVKTFQGLHGAYDRFLEGKHILNKSLDEGLVSEHEVPGWKMLDGATTGMRQLYAPEEVATMWNRYFGPDARDPTSKSFLQTVQRIKNATTAFQLIGGGYHLFGETAEAFIGDLQRAIQQAAAGNFKEAGKRALGAPLAPYRQAFKSAPDAFKEYYNSGSTTPQMKAAINDLTSAGFTPERINRYTPEFNITRGFMESWHKAALKLDMQELGEQAKQGYGVGAAKSAFQLAGKGMQTMMEPLFNWYIPRLKVGAVVEQYGDWLAANPNASREVRQDVAKRILKSVDDRLGEMNQSTLFWNNTIKKAANLLMISPGWETGTIRAAIGGAGSFIKNPKSVAINSGADFRPNSAWPFAFAIGTAMIGSMYQMLKTGKPPEDAKDPFFPKTGGVAANSGQPERAILPGYLKDVHSWWGLLAGQDGLTKNASGMLYNKLALVPKTVWDTMADKDWSGHQIYNPSDPMHDKMRQWVTYAQRNMMPIIVKQGTDKSNPRSNITKPEALVGIRHAPGDVQDRVKAEEGARARNDRAQQESERFHKRIGD